MRRPVMGRLWTRLLWPHAQIGPKSRLALSAEILATPDHPVVIGRRGRIHRGVILDPRDGFIRIGENCSINPYSVLYGHGGLTIGRDVRIAAHVVVVAANHVFADGEATIVSQGLTREGVEIEDDVWIGAGARILDGVTIARGCVIAAGAVVHRSTEPMGIYGGIPARRIGERGASSVDAEAT